MIVLEIIVIQREAEEQDPHATRGIYKYPRRLRRDLSGVLGEGHPKQQGSRKNFEARAFKKKKIKRSKSSCWSRIACRDWPKAPEQVVNST